MRNVSRSVHTSITFARRSRFQCHISSKRSATDGLSIAVSVSPGRYNLDFADDSNKAISDSRIIPPILIQLVYVYLEEIKYVDCNLLSVFLFMLDSCIWIHLDCVDSKGL